MTIDFSSLPSLPLILSNSLPALPTYLSISSLSILIPYSHIPSISLTTPSLSFFLPLILSISPPALSISLSLPLHFNFFCSLPFSPYPSFSPPDLFHSFPYLLSNHLPLFLSLNGHDFLSPFFFFSSSLSLYISN